jgi:hypothetical protein
MRFTAWQPVSLMSFCLLYGCAQFPPRFDVPTDKRNVPSTASIVERITCELVDMVRDDGPKRSDISPLLIAYDYQVAMLLSLDVNDTGSIAPSFNFPHGTFATNFGLTLSQSRQDTLSINLTYSMRDLARRYLSEPELRECPSMDTNLAGNLGLRRTVTAALETPGLNTNPANLSPTSGEFSGSVNFVVTKSIDQAGPTWTLENFKGPGNLGSLSSVNTDKLSFAFATGPQMGTKFDPKAKAPLPSERAGRRLDDALQRQLNIDLGTQLSGIRGAIQ